MSDTNSRAGIEVKLWQMQPEYVAGVQESLSNHLGMEESTLDFPLFLQKVAQTATEDNLEDYLAQLQEARQESLLESLLLQFGNIRERIQDLLARIRRAGSLPLLNEDEMFPGDGDEEDDEPPF